MYDNIKDWINVPFVLRPYLNRSGTGAKMYSADVPALCYPVSNIEVIRNTAGKEVVSSLQLYVDNSLVVSELDSVIFGSREADIQKLGSFYKDGSVDMWVIYI